MVREVQPRAGYDEPIVRDRPISWIISRWFQPPLPSSSRACAWVPLPADSWGRGHFPLRYDLTDGKGVMTLRRGGRMHHLKVGAAHARRRVLAIVDEQEVTVVDLATGEILSTHLIEPGKGYWRNQQRDPGRWPGSGETS
jgi:hypothetical protein